MDTNKHGTNLHQNDRENDENSNLQRPGQSTEAKSESTKESYDSEDTDKYLAMEQSGVTFTPDADAPLLNSDNIEDGVPEGQDLWDAEKPNSRNSEAFNQDEFLLEDNLDLDEDKSKSISSDD